MLVKSEVQIVDQIVPIINCVADCSEHPRSLQPWFTVRILNIRIGSEEWHEGTKLVELDPDVVCWIAPKTWDIAPCPGHPRHAINQIHDQTSVYLLGNSLIVASPHGTVLLRAQEVTSGQHKRSLCLFISAHKSSVGTPVLQSSIDIVQVTVHIIRPTRHIMQ